jgi:hypothetical protein
LYLIINILLYYLKNIKNLNDMTYINTTVNIIK